MKTAVYVSGRNTGTVVSRWLHMRLFVSCKLPVSQSVIIIIMSTTVFVALSSWREFTRSCVCSLRLPESQFHMIGISAPSHFSCCVHASVTKNCFVVVRLLGTKRGFICETLPLPSVLWRCWLGGRKGIRPVKNWVVRCWCGYLSGARCRLAYGPADATATHYLLLQYNPDWFYLSGTGSQGRLRHINDGANAHEKNRGWRFLQELRGEVRKLFMHFPPKFLPTLHWG